MKKAEEAFKHNAGKQILEKLAPMEIEDVFLSLL